MSLIMDKITEDEWILEIKNEMEEFVKEKSSRYSFDFEVGEPIQGFRYQWSQGEPVSQGRRVCMCDLTNILQFTRKTYKN